MFEFFVGLFGGVHYGGKILAESAEVKRFDKSSAETLAYHNQRLQLWRSQVSDRSTEEDLKLFIADPKNYKKVWGEVHEAYLNMPTCKSCTTILLHEPMVLRYYGRDAYTKKQRENIAEHERRWALSIMLARRGKVSSSGFLDRSAGVDARLIFKKGLVGEEQNRAAYDVDDVEKFRYQAGQLTWLPLTYYGENLQRLKVQSYSNR